MYIRPEVPQCQVSVCIEHDHMATLHPSEQHSVPRALCQMMLNSSIYI